MVLINAPPYQLKKKHALVAADEKKGANTVRRLIYEYARREKGISRPGKNERENEKAPRR